MIKTSKLRTFSMITNVKSHIFSMISSKKTVTACSSSDDDDTPATGDIKTNIVGTWELTHIKGWYWADDEDESHITVDKSPESDDKFRFSLNANGGCIWYDYDAGTWKSYSGITKYELNANILIIKDSYSSGDETDWQTCKRFKIVSIKGNTMICTVCLMDEDDTELTFTKR